MKTVEKTLELDKILQKLKEYASTSLGIEAINEMKVSTDIDEINNKLDETDEALKLIVRIGNIPLGGISDIRQAVKRAQIGGVLSIEELVNISSFAYGVNQIKLYLDRVNSERIGSIYISKYINQLIPLTNLRKRIDACIDNNGNILDDASPKLKDIRQQIKVLEARIREKMNQILSTKSSYLTDTIITIRNDRFVVPVRVEYKNTFEGIIHDISQSGNTVFIEPKVVVELNNRVNSLKHEENEEIYHILRELSEEVSNVANELLQDVMIVKQLDFIYAKARFALDINAIRPKLNDQGVIKIIKGRHPLIDPQIVVANDVFLGDEHQAMIITGPNTGGKTVTLKMVGLLTLMMQSGLLVPCNEESQLAVFDNVFADIGDEQSIEQSLSTFSSHMKNIINITNNITINSLVLLDELGAGTDPKEGAALAESILDYLLKRGARIIATTHYSELKTYAYNTDKVINASVEFDVETLRPTYKLLIGIPGRSNALEISRRLGLNEKIIAQASSRIETEKTDVSKLITQLENQGLYLDKLINENEALKKELQSQILKYELLNNELANQKDTLKEKAYEEARQIVRKAQKEANLIIEELKRIKKERVLDVKDHEISELKGKLRHLIEQDTDEQLSSTSDILKPGDVVKVLTLNRTGELIEQVNEDEWLVRLGNLNSRIHKQYLELVKSSDAEKKRKKEAEVRVIKKSTAHLELDLRGERYEEAIIKLDKFIDEALINNISQVVIIHGHGTGALRKGVQDYLKKCPYVKEFRYGGEGEGGVGVTVVTLS
ncbi:MAG: endonuclease MutS2 [Bacilli bacterium]|nr:endonuclease MutS2 [Bacilli bacterium]